MRLALRNARQQAPSNSSVGGGLFHVKHLRAIRQMKGPKAVTDESTEPRVYEADRLSTKPIETIPPTNTPIYDGLVKEYNGLMIRQPTPLTPAQTRRDKKRINKVQNDVLVSAKHAPSNEGES